MRAAASVFAEMLDGAVPDDFVLAPLPTIARHVRERGFDHVGLIANKMKLPMARVLVRNKNSVQVGASREKRAAQAKEAYRATNVDPEAKYLLFDDVWTTGSSMMAAIEKLREAGAKKIGIVVIARS